MTTALTVLAFILFAHCYGIALNFALATGIGLAELLYPLLDYLTDSNEKDVTR